MALTLTHEQTHSLILLQNRLRSQSLLSHWKQLVLLHKLHKLLLKGNC